MSCQPIAWPPCPVPECPEQIVYASQNGNLTGIGVLDSNTASLGTFRGVVGDGAFISTTLDAPNKSVVVSLISGNIAAAVPQATEATAGKGEVATQAETNAGVSDTTFVTPLKLQTRQATTTMFGLGRLGTQAEINVGTVADALVTSLTLGTRLLTVKATRVFGNAAVRASATPDFDGQVGVQLDTEMVYTATGLAAGNWQSSFLQPNTTTTLSADTTISLNGNAWVFQDGATEHVRIDSGVMTFSGSVGILAGTNLNFATTSTLSVNNVTIPADSLMATSGTAGRPTSLPRLNFLSTYNPEATWAAPTGTLARTTFDQSTVTLPELAKRVAALITDLLAVKLPQEP